MNNRNMTGVLLTAFVLFVLAAGCNPQQVQFAAQQAGMVAAATWMSKDTPSTNAISSARGIISLVREKAGEVEAGQRYYAVLRPDVYEWIDENVSPADRPICQIGANWILTGIDGVIAMNPSVAEKQSSILAAVNAFLDGAVMGLDMSRNDPVIRALSQATDDEVAIRSIVLKERIRALE